ncbi:murein L,D-transpeptidase catalytic domain family protein [Desertivirga arenae]|uniref:murein L,D-transpeptidase catalytic domain family protein n=1 Tax=Desertivirga arenae TaxID=2810309 RepID=UPI001A979847|nr:murein L,D-transpeptidase catalytic domain family protein [Pedobacter sp. SYSU D00823]
MRKRIFRGASLALLALSLPAIGWSLNDPTDVKAAIAKDTAVIESPVAPTETISAATLFNKHISEIYDAAQLDDSGLDFDVFKKAVTGYYNFKNSNLVSTSKEVISIVDFTRASTKKRLWIIDLGSRKVLFNTLVAHGQGSGDNFATSFSNLTNSHQSSLGFYITSNTYFGKHGLSLKLNGMDNGYNTNALNRAVVVHGAEYVSQSFINQHGRLGRSHGCPAVPVELTPSIIEAIKGGTTLFINGPSSKAYASTFLDEGLAVNTFNKNKTQLNAVL